MKRLATSVLLIAVLAACGGQSATAEDQASDLDTATTSAAGTDAGPEEELAAFNECLAEQGVDHQTLPQGGFGQPVAPTNEAQTPPPGDGGPDGDLDQETLAALEECMSLLGE